MSRSRGESIGHGNETSDSFYEFVDGAKLLVSRSSGAAAKGKSSVSLEKRKKRIGLESERKNEGKRKSERGEKSGREI